MRLDTSIGSKAGSAAVARPDQSELHDVNAATRVNNEGELLTGMEWIWSTRRVIAAL